MFDILSSEKIKNSEGHVIAQKTLLGWIAVGRQHKVEEGAASLIAAVNEQEQSISIDKCLRAFWEMEEIYQIYNLN